ncbi:hypothetical protein CR513_45191, partial [Mucuna pruriens]
MDFYLRKRGCECPKVLLENYLSKRHMRRDVHHICDRYLVCKVAKSKVSPHGLYISLPIPTSPWVDISMDFVHGFPRSKGGRDSIFVVVDRFSKMTHFIPCQKVNDVCHVANYFFRKVVRLHSLSKTIALDRDSEFHNHFGEPYGVSSAPSYYFPPPVINKRMDKLKLVNTNTSHSPFELVYAFNPLPPLDLLPLQNVSSILN